MEDNIKRSKKKDKAKEKFKRNGGFSTKHVRITEDLIEKKKYWIFYCIRRSQYNNHLQISDFLIK